MLSVALTFVFVGSALAQDMTPEAKESYSLGASLGNYLSSQAFKQSELGAPVNMDLVVEGLMDALKNKSKLSEEEIVTSLNTRAEKLNQLHEAKVKEVKEKNRAESLAYLEKNKKKKGVKVLASGVQYEELKAGTGPSPKEEDVVTMVYVGKLVNGTPFTNAEGTPAEEKDVVMTLIPGFKEGLSQMKEGGKAVFVIPADKGYGENGAGPVPPESALIFEVTLKKVEKPGANKESNQAMPAGHPPMNGSRPNMAWPHRYFLITGSFNDDRSGCIHRYRGFLSVYRFYRLRIEKPCSTQPHLNPFTDYSSSHRFVVGCVRFCGPLFRLGKGSGGQHQRSSSRGQDHSGPQSCDE